MKYCFIGFLLIAITSYSQEQVLSKISGTGTSIMSFIPPGYDTLETAYGDLNKDGINDAVLVLSHKKEKAEDAKNDPDSIPSRLMVVLLKTNDKYMVAGKSASAIMCSTCGGVFGEPFAGISITNGILVIDHFGGSSWRWSYTHKFRFQGNNFVLIGKTSSSFWTGEMCDKLNEFAGTKYEDVNLVTGQYEKKEVSTEGCKLLVNKKGKMAVKPLIKLSDFRIDN